MTDEPIDSELDKLLGLLAEEEGEPGPGEHPDDATLSAYYDRALPEGEIYRVQEHLVTCRRCRDQLLEHARFMEPPVEDPAEGVSSFEQAAEWRRLKERMEPAEARAPGPSMRSLRVFQALAAVFAALAVGLFVRDVYRQDPVRVLPEQEISFGATRSVSEPTAPRIRPPVALRILPDADYSKYRVEIEPPGGKPKQTLEITPADDLNGVLIEIPGGWEAGTYKIRVLGLKEGRAEPVGRAKEIVIVR